MMITWEEGPYSTYELWKQELSIFSTVSVDCVSGQGRSCSGCAHAQTDLDSRFLLIAYGDFLDLSC